MPWWDNQTLVPFKAHSSVIISGSTGCGKTRLLHRILLNNNGMWTEKPIKIVYCYGIWQTFFNQIERDVPGILFHSGIPTLEDIDSWNTKHTLIILDDLMQEVCANSVTQKIFTMGCHNRHLSCVFITQNLFHQGKFARGITLNATYLIIFENIRDSAQVQKLGHQLFPGKSKGFMHAYRDIMKTSYGYMVVDMNPQANPRYRVRTLIFPGDDPHIYLL